MLHFSLLNLLALHPERALVIVPREGQIQLDERHDARVLRDRVRPRLVPQHPVNHLPPLLSLRKIDERHRRAQRRRVRLDQHLVRALLVLQVREVHVDVWDAGPVGGPLEEAVGGVVACRLVVLGELLKLHPSVDVRPGEVQTANDRRGESDDDGMQRSVVVQCFAFL